MHHSVFVCYSMNLSDCYSALVVTIEQSCSSGVPHQVTDTGVLQLGGDMEPLGGGRGGGGESAIFNSSMQTTTDIDAGKCSKNINHKFSIVNGSDQTNNLQPQHSSQYTTPHL